MEGNEKEDLSRQSLHHNKKAWCLALVGIYIYNLIPSWFFLCFVHMQQDRDNHVFVHFLRSKFIPSTLTEFLSLLIPQFPISVSMKLSYGEDFTFIQTCPFKNNNHSVCFLIILYRYTMRLDHIHHHCSLLRSSSCPIMSPFQLNIIKK